MTDPSSAIPGGVLYLATWLPAELHDQFSAWCDDHHREQLILPGFKRARRFEWVSGGREDNPPQYLTMYDLDSLAALHSDAYVKHTKSSGGLPDFLRGYIRVERRNCEVLAALPSKWWPPTRTPLLDLFHLNDDKLAIGLREHINVLDSAAQTSADHVTVRIIDSEDNEPLVLLDHSESATDMINTITAASGSLRSSWRCVFDELSDTSVQAS